MEQVSPSTPYKADELRSDGRAQYMLLVQYQFPDEWNPELDKMHREDHDHVMNRRRKESEACFLKHTYRNEFTFKDWLARKPSPEKIMAFLKEYLQVDSYTEWTGFRIRATLHQGTGVPVYHMELFAKHPNSKTEVYSGEDAPNVVGAGK